MRPTREKIRDIFLKAGYSQRQALRASTEGYDRAFGIDADVPEKEVKTYIEKLIERANSLFEN